jgi:plastocyanin
MVRSVAAACSAALALVVLAAFPARAAPAEGASSAAASVRGRVELLRKRLFAAPEPAAGASGVLVYLTGFARPAPPALALLEQRDEQFHPRILPIVAGQAVSFPNRDRIYHNVFSVSAVHPFDLGQYRSVDPPRREVFERPGLVPVYCNIHPRMISYLVVLENDAFALTGADGRFAIENAPAGRVTLNAWAPGAERVSRELELRAGGALELELSLVAGAIPPHKRKDGSDYPRPGLEAER